MSLDSILNQIKFSGVPAKFAGAGSRVVTIQVNLDVNAWPQYSANLSDLANTLATFMRRDEWSVNSITRFDQDGAAGLLINVNVDNEYTLAQVKNSITDLVVNKLGWSLYGGVVVQGGEGGISATPNTVVNPGHVIVTPNGTPNPNPSNNTVVKTTEKKNWFDKTFFDGAGALTGAGIGILLVVGVVAVTSSQRR